MEKLFAITIYLNKEKKYLGENDKLYPNLNDAKKFNLEAVWDKHEQMQLKYGIDRVWVVEI